MRTMTELVTAFLAFAPFSLKLLLGDILFGRLYERKPHFVARACLFFALHVAASILLYAGLQGVRFWVISNTLYYFLVFALSAILLKVLYNENISRLLSCAVGGYMMEHISTQVFVVLFYRWQETMFEGEVTWQEYGLYLALQMAIYLGILWMTDILLIRNATDVKQTPALAMRMQVLSIVTLFVVLILSSARDQYAAESLHLMRITRLFSLFCCAFLLYIRYAILEKSQMEAERAQTARIMAMERKQYEQSRENIELINIKCHDMRHKIDIWESRNNVEDREELADIRKMIDIYDRKVQTGNEVLDTLLTERSLFCEKNGIRLSCMADGAKMGFLQTGDICALFGNAIENAIEAVNKLPDPEERNISLQVKVAKGMLVISVENSYEGELTMENGLPKSIKGDDANHGFGMKSIRQVAEKYGGSISVRADELFHLTVLIPVPE
ncbi:MAG: GHKL domain-containing protein [Lachnospiraceae bacterium]|nr:GHKL domain-containing protein [Lachnospiraceae bacterium]